MKMKDMKDMKVLILSDLEGVSGLYSLSDEAENTRFYTLELCAVIDALHAIGVRDITVCDAHDSGDTLDRDVMRSKGADVIAQFWNIDVSVKYDMALLTGFHGMNGAGGCSPHTFRPDIQSLAIDGLYNAGEVEVFMRWLALHEIPVVFVSGDDAAAREAARSDPHITACVVKGGDTPPKSQVCCIHDNMRDQIKLAVLNATHSLSYGIDNALNIQLVNEDLYMELPALWNITSSGLLFNGYDDFVCSIKRLCSDLNHASYVVISRSFEFVNAIRPELSIYPKQDIMRSEISRLLSKTPLSLTAKDRAAIHDYIQKLKSDW